MSDTMKAALDAALRFHDGDARDLDATVASARRFHQEIAGAAPAADDPWDEEWFSRVGTWLRSLSGDQLGSVRGQLASLERSRQPMARPVAPPPPFDSSFGYAQTRGRMAMSEIPLTQTTREERAAAESAIDSGNPPSAVPGTWIRVRPQGADVYLTDTYTCQLLYGPEGFHVLVPPGTFSEAAADQLDDNSAKLLLKLLAPAGLRGTIAQQVKELVGTAKTRLDWMKRLKEQEKAKEAELCEILGALPGYMPDSCEDEDDWIAAENSITAAKRVMKELSIARARIVDLEKS